MSEPLSRTKPTHDACYSIPAEEIARRCRVDVATARRWKRGARRAPATSLMILAEDLGCFDPASYPHTSDYKLLMYVDMSQGQPLLSLTTKELAGPGFP